MSSLRDFSSHLSINLMSAGFYRKKLLRFLSQIRLSLITNHSSPIFPTSLNFLVSVSLCLCFIHRLLNLPLCSSFRVLALISLTAHLFASPSPSLNSAKRSETFGSVSALRGQGWKNYLLPYCHPYGILRTYQLTNLLAYFPHL